MPNGGGQGDGPRARPGTAARARAVQGAAGGRLTARGAFNAAVFARDGCKCVLCGDAAVDAHHILDRKLFPDGGYDPDNGASVCGPCHLLVEATTVSCHEVRRAAGIATVVLPPSLPAGRTYDKWGNEELPGGLRVAGPLAGDDGCRRALASANLLHLLVEPDGLPIPDWVGYSLPDPGSRRDWRAAVASLDEAYGDGVLANWLFHGTGADRAAEIEACGVEPTDALRRDGGGQWFDEGSFWGTPLTAAWYAEDTFLERGAGAPTILACPVPALEAECEIVPDEAMIDFPDLPLKTRTQEELDALWEAEGDDPSWEASLEVWGAVLCRHQAPLEGLPLATVSSPADAGALADLAAETMASPNP